MIDVPRAPALSAPSPAQSKFSLSQISPGVSAKLLALAQAFAAYDFKAARKVEGDLASDWAATKEWLKGVRHIVTLGLLKSGTR